MRIGLSSAAFSGRMETEEEAARTAALGVPCCEVFLETFSEYSGDFGREVRARLGETECVSVHPKGTQFESDLFGRSRRQVEDAMAWFAGVCDAGRALGAKYYIFHGPPGKFMRLRLRWLGCGTSPGQEAWRFCGRTCTGALSARRSRWRRPSR